jgi:hypothetical protein
MSDGLVELLRFRSCWRLQFIAQLVGAFDGVYDGAIGTRDLGAQSFRTPASFFYTRPRRFSARSPRFFPARASGCDSGFSSHRDILQKSVRVMRSLAEGWRLSNAMRAK